MEASTPTIYTVSTLNRYIKTLLDDDLVLRSIWVRGEISNFTHHSSGHMYFTLKDSDSRLKTVMFKSGASRLQFRPTDGMRVLALGNVSVYDRSGDVQLYVSHMEPEGKGSLFVAFEQLRDKLTSEGLFAPSRKRPMPAMPKRIAVLTSPTGAAVRDIISIALRRFPGIGIVVVPTLVQGESAPASIVESLSLVNDMDTAVGRVDLIILGRGGGSIEELWAFNDESVARAIAASRLPVVSAVGHESDFTIADFVADMRAPTPSGAAELVVPDKGMLRDRLSRLELRLGPALRRNVRAKREKLSSLATTNVLRSPVSVLHSKRQEVDGFALRISRAMAVSNITRKATLGQAVAKLDAMSPLSVLSRGYSICTDSRANVIMDASTQVPNSNVFVRLSRGSLECSVIAVSTAAFLGVNKP